MNKKTKIISALGIVSTLAATTDFFFCRTLFNQALYRKKIKKRKQFTTSRDAMNDSQAMHFRREYLSYKQWIQSVCVRKTSITNQDGLNLVASLYSNATKSHKWVILVHGYLGKKEDMKLYARRFHMQGYHVLVPDLRAHGESEGDYITMGWLDRLDLTEWISFILQMDKQAQIILYGTSMGGSAVMMCAGEKLPDNVKCIIEDSGFTSVYAIVTHLLQFIYKMPAFPVINSLSILIKQRIGFSIKKASALTQLSKTKLPILFIHGDHNIIVPTAMAHTLYERCPGKKQLYIVKNSDHNITMFSEPDVYFSTIFQFIQQYIDK